MSGYKKKYVQKKNFNKKYQIVKKLSIKNCLMINKKKEEIKFRKEFYLKK